MSAVLTDAIKYHRKGFWVIPIDRQKKPRISLSKCKAVGENQIVKWWRKWPDSAIGIVTGKASNLTVLVAGNSDDSHRLDNTLPDSLLTPIAVMPGGRRQYWFNYANIANQARVFDQCFIRNDGSFVFAPRVSSSQNSGWLEGLSPFNVPLANMPEKLIGLCSSPHANHVEIKDQIDTELGPLARPKLDRRALYGLAGQFVELATRNSEADPAAVLATFLVHFGVEVGRCPVLWIGDSRHRCRLASVVVGASSKARKGTSSKPVDRLFKFGEILTDSYRPAATTPGPFSSGEGIIFAVRDEETRWDPKQKKEIITDPGVVDKRLFVLDEEFAAALSCGKREGNTLSVVIRQIWDGGDLEPLTKTHKIRATGAHVGWVSHITLSELHQKMAAVEAFSGFANRIMWVYARRPKLVPLPEPMDTSQLSYFQKEVLGIVRQNEGDHDVRMKLGADARQAWVDEYYAQLTQGHPGLVGSILNRSEVQVLRLAMVYTLLDRQKVIGLEHLQAARAFWDYCMQSVKFIFQGFKRDNVAQKILEALRNRGLPTTEVFKLFDNNINKERLNLAMAELIEAGLVEKHTTSRNRPGRPKVIFTLKGELTN